LSQENQPKEIAMVVDGASFERSEWGKYKPEFRV
jgi:hypothetical protein